ncbi:MAG: hypothetical protein LBS66_01980 [Rhodospirillaceae bacterium]|nr:hypothetical protein [Rhodospirillaceae bacterium]
MTLILTIIIFLSLSACGKYGYLKQQSYFRTYPDPNLGPIIVIPEEKQQNLNSRFTIDGSYIDVSASVLVTPKFNFLNTTRVMSLDPFDQGIRNEWQVPLMKSMSMPISD